jgi:GAF domain-containing protein
MSAPRPSVPERAWTPTTERVELLVALSDVISDAGPTRDGMIEAAAAVLAERLADGVSIVLLSGDGRWMTPIGTGHPAAGPRAVLRGVEGQPFPADEGFSACVLDTGQAVLIPRVTAAEIRALQPAIAPPCEAIGLRGFIALPLAARRGCTGIVWQLRTREAPELSDDDVRFLAEVGARLALAIESWS